MFKDKKTPAQRAKAREKRDAETIAVVRKEGYAAFKAGKPLSTNPHFSLKFRNAWKHGWTFGDSEV